MITILILPLYDDIVPVYLYLFSIGDNGYVKMLCYLRTNLRGIAVYSLASRDDKVIVEIPDAGRDG